MILFPGGDEACRRLHPHAQQPSDYGDSPRRTCGVLVVGVLCGKSPLSFPLEY